MNNLSEPIAERIKQLHETIQENKVLLHNLINITTAECIELGSYLLDLPKQKRINFINEYLEDIPENIIQAYITIARTNKNKDTFQIDRRYFSLLQLTEARVTKAKAKPKIKLPAYITWASKLNAYVNSIDKNNLTNEEINIISKQFEPIIEFSKTNIR